MLFDEEEEEKNNSVKDIDYKDRGTRYNTENTIKITYAIEYVQSGTPEGGEGLNGLTYFFFFFNI